MKHFTVYDHLLVRPKKRYHELMDGNTVTEIPSARRCGGPPRLRRPPRVAGVGRTYSVGNFCEDELDEPGMARETKHIC